MFEFLVAKSKFLLESVEIWLVWNSFNIYLALLRKVAKFLKDNPKSIKDGYVTDDDSATDYHFVDGDIPPMGPWWHLNGTPPTGSQCLDTPSTGPQQCLNDNRVIFNQDNCVCIHSTVRKRLRAIGMMNVRALSINVCSSYSNLIIWKLNIVDL